MPLPERLPIEDALRLRQQSLAELPRIGTSIIQTQERLIHRLEDIALHVGDTLVERKAHNHPQWWRDADLLDDIMDVLDAVKSKHFVLLTKPRAKVPD